ncbi:hypothetical protein IUY40_16905 [Flavobacterium sp. ALJ2]|uniref:hypothetical protein n=1 Tax=Flavobacterium sp. ALJ2 TaxID=2786960 RepID=UPI0018A046E6|nr:hypothetical protein [Flavobacterium sp. ALJ2]MBF7093214.1 hypothetical protein [Flavobacterium sp. ALJ2]
MVTNRFNISTKFENGDIPSQSDFVEIFNSFVHKDEDKADFQMVEAGIDNERYVTPALLNAGLKNIGIITGNCYMPHKETFESTFSGTTLPLKKKPIQYSVKVFKNGQLLQEGPDYTVNYNTAIITFSDEITNRNIEIDYWYKNFSSNPGNGGEVMDFTSFLHTTGNETKKGILTFNNTTPTSTSGIILTNSGVGSTATALDISVSGTGKGISLQNSSTGTGVKVSNTGTGVGTYLNSSAGATGDILQIAKSNIVKTKIDSEGIVTAPKYVTTGGASTQFVKGDGALDSTEYAINSTVIHTTGNETKDGALLLTHRESPQDVLTITKNNSANCLKLVQTSNSNATTATWDTSTPNANRKAISIQKQEQENAFITHEGDVTANSFTTQNSKAILSDGLLTLIGSEPPKAIPGQAKLYAKTDDTTDLYVMGSDGIEKKIGGTTDITGNSYLPHKENFESSFTGDTLSLKKLPIEYSVKVYKNGQLLHEGQDYTVNYNNGIIKFSDKVTDRNIEIDYWYKSLISNPNNSGRSINTNEPSQITITTAVNITTDTLNTNGKKQIGKNVIIDNGTSTINVIVNGGTDFYASYLKHGIGTITFVQGVGRTLVITNRTAILNGTVGSTATISSIGTTDYLKISNL